MQQFLVSSGDTMRICATLQALTWRLQQSQNIKQTIEETFISEDVLGCLEDSQFKVLDSLVRSQERQVRSFTFSLLNTLATFQDGKKYLLQKQDLIECTVSALTNQSHINALTTLPLEELPTSIFGANDTRQESLNECHIHRTLISLLFKLSQAKRSHDKITRSKELTDWILTYLGMVTSLFDPASNRYLKLSQTPLSVTHVLENSLGLLQNISLKREGLDKILHF